jgi:hypothetical protein
MTTKTTTENPSEAGKPNEGELNEGELTRRHQQRRSAFQGCRSSGDKGCGRGRCQSHPGLWSPDWPLKLALSRNHRNTPGET